MEILCGFGLSLPPMKGDWLKKMSHYPVLDAETRCWSREVVEQDNEPIDAYWPEVSTRYSRENPAPIKPENAQERVLSEIFLVLAAAGVLVAVVTIWLPRVVAL